MNIQPFVLGLALVLPATAIACSRETVQVRAATPIEFTLSVEGMTCPACEDRIHTAVMRVPGVVACKVDHVAARAQVLIDTGQVGIGTVAAAIRAAGFTVPLDETGGSCR